MQAARLAACESVYPDCRGLDQRRAGGGRGMSAAARACPAPKPALPAKRVLGADALFAFDRADLSTSPSERREKLDQLAQDVQQVDTVKQLTITGYTDRLGSAAYNLRLSERRAQAVKHYLAARGVRA